MITSMMQRKRVLLKRFSFLALLIPFLAWGGMGEKFIFIGKVDGGHISKEKILVESIDQKKFFIPRKFFPKKMLLTKGKTFDLAFNELQFQEILKLNSKVK